jgi:hypothetical protein
MTVTVYLLATLIGVKMNFVDALATMLGGWKMGMLVHVLNGAIIFPLAYVVFLYRFFPGPAYLKGLTFGLMLWLASQLLILPLIGAGLFSSQMGGIRASGTLLLGHLAYGPFGTPFADCSTVCVKISFSTLAELTYFDSFGLGQLIASNVEATSQGGAIKLLNLNTKNTRSDVAYETLHGVCDLYG